MGARLLRRWVLSPLRDVAAITSRLDAVEAALQNARAREVGTAALDGVRDIERLAGRAAAGRATPRDLGALRDSFLRLPADARGSGRAGRDGRADGPYRQSASTASTRSTIWLPALVRALADRPPVSLADGDVIRPGFDAELDELRVLRDGGQAVPGRPAGTGARAHRHSRRSRSATTRSSGISSK